MYVCDDFHCNIHLNRDESMIFQARMCRRTNGWGQLVPSWEWNGQYEGEITLHYQWPNSNLPLPLQKTSRFQNPAFAGVSLWHCLRSFDGTPAQIMIRVM